MTRHAFFEIAFSVACFAALGCEKKEPVVVERPYQEPVVVDFQEGTDYVLSVGMPLGSAIDMLGGVGLPAVDDQSAHAFHGGTRPRSLLLGANATGDALFLIADIRADGSDYISHLFWHGNWVAESKLAKSERRDSYSNLHSIDLKTAGLQMTE